MLIPFKELFKAIEIGHDTGFLNRNRFRQHLRDENIGEGDDMIEEIAGLCPACQAFEIGPEDNFCIKTPNSFKYYYIRHGSKTTRIIISKLKLDLL